MARYNGYRRSITPNTSNDNWTLDASSSVSCKVLEVNWGGEVTTSTAMQTRIARGASAASSTAGNVAKTHPRSPTNGVVFATAWTTQPTLDAGDLYATSWNAHGGVVRWLAAPGEEFILIGAAQIGCRNTSGTGTSTYGTCWEED